MYRFWLVLALVAGLLLLAMKPMYAQEPVTWQGEIDGVTTWITVVPRGHEISSAVMETEPWWKWGNTSTDAYLFAFGDPEDVRLILSFSQMSDGRPKAELFVSNLGEDPVDHSLSSEGLEIRSNNGYPYIGMWPKHGGWFAGDSPNYDLELAIDGPYPRSEFGEPKELITDGIVDIAINVVEQAPGIPAWETVTLVNDTRPYSPYRRFAMLKRMEDAPEYKVASSVMPTFPHLNIGNMTKISWYVENRNPLFFDFGEKTFRVNPFTGFQIAGQYSINSSAYAPNVNFESPFVFYDFFGNDRTPELSIRSVYYPEGDPILPSYAREETLSSYRYSWASDEEGKWTYSVNVVGKHPYTNTLELDQTKLFAVQGEELPTWIMSRDWPVITFVEATDGFTGEGIYFYSMQNTSIWPWLYGQTDATPPEFKDPIRQDTSSLVATSDRSIPVGFRGEYSADYSHRPTLYFSPVDNRLHLKNAEGGVWNLEDGLALRYENLDKDDYIDEWRLTTIATATMPATVNSQLNYMSGYFIYSDEASVVLRQAPIDPAAFETLPPRNSEEWKQLQGQLQTAESHHDPTNLLALLDQFGGPRSEIAGASVANARFTEDGFRFELTLEPDYQVTGPDLLGLEGLAPGEYLIENQDGAFLVAPLIPAQLSLTVRQTTEDSATASVQVTFDNMGSADASDLILVVQAESDSGGTIELANQPVQALAGETTQVLVNVPSTLAAGGALRVRLEDGQGQVVATGEWTPLSGPDRSYRSAIYSIDKAPVLLPVAGMFAALIALAALSAVIRRRGQATP